MKVEKVNNRDEILYPKGWSQATDRLASKISKAKTVNSHGKEISKAFSGRKYKLVDIAQTPFSGAERFARLLLALFATLLTLGLACISKKVQGLFTREHRFIQYIMPVDQPKSPGPDSAGATTTTRIPTGEPKPGSKARQMVSREYFEVFGDEFLKEGGEFDIVEEIESESFDTAFEDPELKLAGKIETARRKLIFTTLSCSSSTSEESSSEISEALENVDRVNSMATQFVSTTPTVVAPSPTVTTTTLPSFDRIGTENLNIMAEQLPLAEVIASTPAIAKDFTTSRTIEEQRAAHESAKAFLKMELARVGAVIDFISHDKVSAPALSEIEINTANLFPAVFRRQYTTGVLGDIRNDGSRMSDTVVVYGVASQFNGCEAPNKYTIQPGKAKGVYENDRTQGPQAQLAFADEQVELINCGGNLGFNGLCNLLDEDTKDQIAHGYFTPTEEKAEKVIQLLRNNGQTIEYSCIANVPNGGEKAVHQILVAAPAFGMYANASSAKGANQDEIQFLCALHSYRAQFHKCVDLAQESGKPVQFKATAGGLGVFGNNPAIVAKAFYQAAMEYQDALKDNKVTVLFQIFNGGYGPDAKADSMADHLGLQTA